MWIELVGLVGLVHYGKGHTEPQPLQVTDLLGKGDGLGGKVHLQLELGGGISRPLTADVEDPPLDHLLLRFNLQHQRRNGGSLSES